MRSLAPMLLLSAVVAASATGPGHAATAADLAKQWSAKIEPDLTQDYTALLNQMGDPTQAESYARLAVLSQFHDFPVGACWASAKAVMLKPDSAAYLNNFGFTLSLLKQYDSAIVVYKEALGRRRTASLCNNLARTHMHKGDYTSAKAAIQAGLALEPDRTQWHLTNYDIALASQLRRGARRPGGSSLVFLTPDVAAAPRFADLTRGDRGASLYWTQAGLNSAEIEAASLALTNAMSHTLDAALDYTIKAIQSPGNPLGIWPMHATHVASAQGIYGKLAQRAEQGGVNKDYYYTDTAATGYRHTRDVVLAMELEGARKSYEGIVEQLKAKHYDARVVGTTMLANYDAFLAECVRAIATATTVYCTMHGAHAHTCPALFWSEAFGDPDGDKCMADAYFMERSPFFEYQNDVFERWKRLRGAVAAVPADDPYGPAKIARLNQEYRADLRKMHADFAPTWAAWRDQTNKLFNEYQGVYTARVQEWVGVVAKASEELEKCSLAHYSYGGMLTQPGGMQVTSLDDMISNMAAKAASLDPRNPESQIAKAYQEYGKQLEEKLQWDYAERWFDIDAGNGRTEACSFTGELRSALNEAEEAERKALEDAYDMTSVHQAAQLFIIEHVPEVRPKVDAGIPGVSLGGATSDAPESAAKTISAAKAQTAGKYETRQTAWMATATCRVTLDSIVEAFANHDQQVIDLVKPHASALTADPWEATCRAYIRVSNPFMGMTVASVHSDAPLEEFTEPPQSDDAETLAQAFETTFTEISSGMVGLMQTTMPPGQGMPAMPNIPGLQNLPELRNLPGLNRGTQ